MKLSTLPLEKKDRYPLLILFICLYSLGYFINNNLYQLGFYQYVNIAFDLDQAWYIDALSRPSNTWLYNTAVAETPLWIKHPLLYCFRLPAELLQLLGFKEDISAILVTLFFIATTPILFYTSLKLSQFSSLHSLILTIAFIFSSTFLVNMMVLDSYSIAQFWILSALVLFLISVNTRSLNNTWLKAIVYVGLAGTTSYLVLFAILCEVCLLLHIKTGNSAKEIASYLLSLSLKFSSIFLLVFAAVYADTLITIVTDPVGVLRKTLWAVARPGEKEGLLKVLETFLGYSVYSPAATTVVLEDKVTMLDFRALGSSMFDYFILASLIGFYLLSLTRLASPVMRLALLWILINTGFHLIYQDRSSLFIYTGHLLPICFLCLCFGITRLKNQVTLVGVSLTLLLIIGNVDIYTVVRQSLALNGQF